MLKHLGMSILGFIYISLLVGDIVFLWADNWPMAGIFSIGLMTFGLIFYNLNMRYF